MKGLQDINKVRDELANAFAGTVPVGEDKHIMAYQQGFDAAVKLIEGILKGIEKELAKKIGDTK